MSINIGKIEADGKCLLTLDEYYLKPPREGVRYDYHTELEISLVKSGSGVYLVDGREYDMCKGDIFILNNIEPHYITSVDAQDGLVNSVIMFDPRLIWSIESSALDLRFLKIFFERNGRFQNRIRGNGLVEQEIAGIFLEIEREFAAKKPEYGLMVKAKLMSLLVCLLRYFDYSADDMTRSSKYMYDLSLISKVINFIDTNLSFDVRVEHLAASVFMSPSHFSAFFKKHTGLKPVEYIIKKRVSRAVEYLKSTDKTVLDIAMLCGFNNTASFNKVFKKYVGGVPSDFRRQK